MLGDLFEPDTIRSRSSSSSRWKISFAPCWCAFVAYDSLLPTSFSPGVGFALKMESFLYRNNRCRILATYLLCTYSDCCSVSFWRRGCRKLPRVRSVILKGTYECNHLSSLRQTIEGNGHPKRHLDEEMCCHAVHSIPPTTVYNSSSGRPALLCTTRQSQGADSCCCLLACCYCCGTSARLARVAVGNRAFCSLLMYVCDKCQIQ